MAVGSDLRAMLDRLEPEGNSRISPVERLLLSTDGTVTHAVEALTKASINVHPVSRRQRGETLLRDVYLEREDNGERMVYAHSEVALEHVEDGIAEELVNGERGIGSMLRNRGAETHRQINSMKMRTSSDPELPMFVGTGSHEYLERTYSVYSDGVELMIITEWFPRSMY
jgi:chorismate-pyruvate lyase